MSASPRSASFWLIALNLVLVAVLAALWLAPGTPARWRGWQAPAPQAPTLDDVRAAVLLDNPAASATYPDLLARPLMSPSRRPQAAAADQPAAEPPTAIDQLKLLGIVAGPALSGVLIDEDGQSRFVRRGERIGDWTLDSLQDRAAGFVRGAERRSIELSVAPADATPAPAGPRSNRGAAQPTVPAPTASPAAVSRPRPASPAPALAAPAATPAPAADGPPAKRGSFGGSAPSRPLAPDGAAR